MSLQNDDRFVVQRGSRLFNVPSSALKSEYSSTAQVYVGDNPPDNPVEGDLWWSSIESNLFIWYDDGNSQQWVDASPAFVDLDYDRINAYIEEYVDTNSVSQIINGQDITVSPTNGKGVVTVSFDRSYLNEDQLRQDSLIQDLDDRVTEIEENGGGGTPIPPITFDVAITGDNKVGDTLTAVVSNLTGGTAPEIKTYVWKSGGVVDNTAVTSTRVNLSSDVGKVITCDITCAEPDGSNPVTKTATYGQVIELSATIDKPTVLTPPNGAGVGGDVSYYPITSEVISVDDPSVFCGSSRPLSDNSVFSGTVWVGDKYLTFANQNPYTILSSTDGKTWTTVSSGAIPDAFIKDMFYDSVNNRLYAFGSSNMYFSDNKGVSFTNTNANTSLAAAQNLTTEEIRIFGKNGNIWLANSSTPPSYPQVVYTTTQWINENIILASHVVDNTYLVVSAGGAPDYAFSLHRTTDGGATWSTPASLPAGSSVRAMGADGAGNTLVFVYPGFKVYKSTDNGASFSEVNSPKDADFMDYLYYTDGWFYGIYERQIFRTNNLGESWEDCGGTQGNTQAIYSHDGFFVVENASGTSGLIAWSSDGITFSANGQILQLTDSAVYSSIDSQPVSLTLEEAFPSNQNVKVFGGNGSTSRLKSISGTSMYLDSNISVNVGEQLEGSTEFTEFAPGADVVEFTSTTPAGTGITTYGNATWQVDTDVNFSSPMTATKAIVDGSNQELLPSERGAITLNPDTTYNVRVKYDAADPSGVESAYSDVNQFKTGGPQDGYEQVQPSGARPEGLAYANNTFVAVESYNGDRAWVANKNDLNSWTSTYTFPMPATRITSGNNLFIASGMSETPAYVYSSNDGTTFTAGALPSQFDGQLISDVIYGDRFILSSDDRQNIGYSSDGVNWSVATNVLSNLNSFNYKARVRFAYGQPSTGIYANQNLYVAVQGGGSVDQNAALYTQDPTTQWSFSDAGTPTGGNGCRCITYANGYFVAANAAYDGQIVYSTDGMTWNTTTSPGGGDSLTYHNGMFIVAKYPGILYTATDPAGTWTKYDLFSELGTFTPYAIESSGDYVVIAASDAGFILSETGLPGTFIAYNATDNKAISDANIVARYGVDPTADNTSLGIYELTEQPTEAVVAYVPDGDKYKPIIDLSQPLEQAQAEAAQANARLDEANATIETIRSTFETRIAALEADHTTLMNNNGGSYGGY